MLSALFRLLVFWGEQTENEIDGSKRRSDTRNVAGDESCVQRDHHLQKPRLTNKEAYCLFDLQAAITHSADDNAVARITTMVCSMEVCHNVPMLLWNREGSPETVL